MRTALERMLSELYGRLKIQETTLRNPDVDVDVILSYIAGITGSARVSTDYTVPTIILPGGLRQLSVGIVRVETSNGPHQINLPAVGQLGHATPLVVKDRTGNAGASPITIVPNGGHQIDNSATRVVNTNFGSVTIWPDLADGDWSVV